jgi:predicted ATPase
MYKSFKIENFRCFDDFTIEPLQRINLIAGQNNVGKTALLEALWLHHGYHNPRLGTLLAAFRGLGQFKRDEFMWDLFSEFDPDKTIVLSSQDWDSQSRSLRITIREHPTSRISIRNGGEEEGIESGLFSSMMAGQMMVGQASNEPAESAVLLEYTGPSGETFQAHAYVEADNIRFESPVGIKEPGGIFLAARDRSQPKVLAERLGDLEVNKKETRIIQILQIIEPGLESLTVRHIGNVPIIYGDVGKKRLIPLALMGDGMGRLLGIALSIPQAQDGILLVDEVENGLHHTVMSKVWRAIADLAREYNVQIFATTHSEECIRAAHRAFNASERYDFALHRLERVEQAIRAITFDRETLDAAIEMDAEVR